MKEMNKLEDIRRNFPYQDILYKSRPKSKRPKLSSEKRAAQFSPFSALTGYEEQINESNRETENKKLLTEEEKIIINDKLNLVDNAKDKKVKITYFVKDKKKSGGKYLTTTDFIRKIDKYNKIIVLDSKIIISIEDILNIEINNYDY